MPDLINANQKIRVAIILTRIDQLGPVKVIQNLINTLIKYDDLDIKIFYLDKKVDEKVRIDVPVERLDPRYFCFSDYDIIHTNGIRPDLFAFLNRKKIRYHISTIHNFVFDDLSFTYNRLISWIFGNIWLIIWKRADKLVCVSKSLMKYYSRWFPITKLEVIYNGITDKDNSYTPDNDIIQSIINFRKDGLKVLGTTGVLTRRKGIDQVLNMIVAEENLAFVIIGGGKELTNLKHLSKKLKISGRCLFCGFRSNAEIYCKHFDFFIMPSRSEGFGLALIEAVQQKVPVICSDIDVFKELFDNNEVIFFQLDEKKSLLAALKTAVESGKINTELAYSRFKKEYTDDIMAKRYFELFKSIS